MHTDKIMENKTASRDSFSDYVRFFYNSLNKKKHASYSDWKWFRSKSSIAQYNQTKNTIKMALGVKKFNDAFEIGPGDGIWTELISDYCKKIDAVDLSEEMLRMAKHRLKNKNVNLNRGDFLKINIKKKYDLVYSIRCIEYLPDKERAIQKISSISKKGTIVVIITKNSKFLKMRGLDRKLHSKQIDILDLKNKMENCGFEIKLICPAVFGKGFHFPIIRNILSKVHNYILKNGTSANNFFVKYFSESFLIAAQKK